MREFKFRAWSEETKSFECFDLYEGTECGFTNLQIWARDSSIEQFTGLKDKNGKEIYEGDIVDYNDDGECIGVVEYDAPEFCLNADATNWARMFLKGAPHQRVIGNIHENPELVKEKE